MASEDWRVVTGRRLGPRGRKRHGGFHSRSARTADWLGAARNCSQRTGHVLGRLRGRRRTAYEGRILSGEAEQDASSLVDNNEPRCCPPSAMTYARRLRRIKAAVSRLRETDVEWSEDERALLVTIEDSIDRLNGVARPARRRQIAVGSLTVTRTPSRSTKSSPAPLDLPDRTASRSRSRRTCRWSSADLGLLQRRSLVNVLDNALRHGGGRPGGSWPPTRSQQCES